MMACAAALTQAIVGCLWCCSAVPGLCHQCAKAVLLDDQVESELERVSSQIQELRDDLLMGGGV